MEIVAYGRSCAEAIFGTPSCHLFNTSHLGKRSVKHGDGGTN
jgi:hypothetical protein